jgi:hypothetical protein
MRLALLLAIPAWSAAALALARSGDRRLAWGATLAAVLGLAAWAGSRVGTANPVSRTGRWDPWLVFVMGTLLLAIPAAAVTWTVASPLAADRPAWQAFGLGALAGLAALPLAFVAAVAVEVLWPH